MNMVMKLYSRVSNYITTGQVQGFFLTGSWDPVTVCILFCERMYAVKCGAF